MASTALVDTGPIVSLFGGGDRHSDRYRKLFQQAVDESWALITTWPCVMEASYMIQPPRRYAMLRWIATGALRVFPIETQALEDMVSLMKQWTEPPRTEMYLADASLVRLAFEGGVTRIMTLDVNDFSRYRLPDGRAFEIL